MVVVGNVLRALLDERHLRSYPDFTAVYRLRAKELDLPRTATPPTKSQYYRWLGDQVQTLPRGHHCAVLEHMFPGYTAEELFSPYVAPPAADSDSSAESVAKRPRRRTALLAAAGGL